MCIRETEYVVIREPHQHWYHDDAHPCSIITRIVAISIAILAVVAAIETGEPSFIFIAFLAICTAIYPRILFETNWGSSSYQSRPAVVPIYMPPAPQRTVVIQQKAPPASSAANYYQAQSSGSTYQAPPLATHVVTPIPAAPAQVEERRALLGARTQNRASQNTMLEDGMSRASLGSHMRPPVSRAPTAPAPTFATDSMDGLRAPLGSRRTASSADPERRAVLGARR